MAKAAANPLFHVSLSDCDEWVVEAEWPDGILQQVSTFKNHSAAAHWVATASKSWLHAQEAPLYAELRQAAKGAQAFPKKADN